MTTALLETEAGRRMLRGALARGEHLQMVTHESEFMRMIFEPERCPHQVYYVDGRVLYVPPERYCFWQPRQPSDSVWIVPGTL